MTGPALNLTPATMPTPPERQNAWVTIQHPFYRANRDKWQFAVDHYTGDILDPKNIEKYLVQRTVGEAKQSYQERCKLADYTNHFAQVVEALAGMVFAVEGDANRVFLDENGMGLGAIDDAMTPIGRLWRRADAKGNGYLTVYKQLSIWLSVTHFAWIAVDAAVPGRPSLKVLSPLSVPNWFEGENGPEVIVMEEIDPRTNIQEQPVPAVQYCHFTTKGWQRYRVDDGGNQIAVGIEGTYHYESPDGQPALPIYPVQLPMARLVGYLLAKKANAIFNKESERDHLLRTANFPKLVLPAGDDQFKKMMGNLAEGANGLQEDPGDGSAGNTRYITPPTEAATIATDVLKQKVEQFHKIAHKEYDDAAGAKRTATQVRQDVSSGTGAYLQLLKSGLDDAENQALWRIEQNVFPEDRRKWFIARVDRTDDFMPDDPDAVLEKSAAVAWGKDKPVPLGRSALVQLAKEIARHRGVDVVDSEIEQAVEVRAMLDLMETSATAGLVLPAVVRVELLMKALGANGFIDSEAVVKLSDGQEGKLFDVVKSQALALMQAADDAKLRESELLTAPAGDPNAGGNPAGGNPSNNPAAA